MSLKGKLSRLGAASRSPREAIGISGAASAELPGEGAGLVELKLGEAAIPALGRADSLAAQGQLPSPRSPLVPSAEVAEPVLVEPVLAESGEAAAEPAAFEALRQKMQAILGRSSAPSPPPLRLPERITEEPTGAGPIHRLRTALMRDYHVGRAPVEAALRASPELLGLLALDPALAAVDLSAALYFDTETTGLGVGTGNLAFLLGLGFFERPTSEAAELKAPRFVVEQLLLRSPADEPAFLEWFRARVSAASVLVSFNGKGFDWPLLCDRFIMNRLAPPEERPHLDLLYVARRLHRARMGSCRLKAVEAEVLGFLREGDIDGADVAPRYGHFLRTGDGAALEAVIEHNHWDVASMAALLGLYGEPLPSLHPLDLVGMAKTLRKNKQAERAAAVNDYAIEQGAGSAGLALRAELAKARGDKARALQDFERLVAEVDDPAVRLELAKLYEHYVKDPERALEVVAQGTGESAAQAAQRSARLQRKLSAQLPLLQPLENGALKVD